MTPKNDILQELNELNSSLTNITTQNIYTVPAGYFDGLAVQMLNRIRAMKSINASDELSYLSPVLNNISRQMPYMVPSGYFEALDETLIQSVRKSSDYQTASEELESLSPLLSGVKKEMPYSIPQGYFDSLSERKIRPEIKVVSITHRKWFRYAAAAVVVGIVVMTGFIVFGNNERQSAQPFAKFENKLNKEIKKMSDKELNDFIQYTDAGLNGEEKVSNNPTEEVKDLLKDVPESELKDFLDETSDAGTESTMMN